MLPQQRYLQTLYGEHVAGLDLMLGVVIKRELHVHVARAEGRGQGAEATPAQDRGIRCVLTPVI